VTGGVAVGALAVALVTGVGAARAQDFACAEPGGPSRSAACLLERGLAAPAGARVEALATSWLGVPGLVTRALCAGAAVRAVRCAVGVSQTGDATTGWSSAAAALATTAPSGGAALRAVARRDADGAASGEFGAGAWLRAGPSAVVWASAPQLATSGAAPPLARGLALGVAVEQGGIGAWFERAAPARVADEAGTHAAGVVLRADPGRVWVEARGRPLRAGLGIAVGPIAVRAIGHPRLGDTVTIALSLPPARATP